MLIIFLREGIYVILGFITCSLAAKLLQRYQNQKTGSKFHTLYNLRTLFLITIDRKVGIFSLGRKDKIVIYKKVVYYKMALTLLSTNTN